MTLKEYIRRRLGNETRVWPLLRNSFIRSFTAPSLARFWHYWNPLYGYYLARFVYRPLRRVLPAGLSTIVTFAFSGFFGHDAFSWPVIVLAKGKLQLPLIGTWFTQIGILVVLTSSLRLEFSSLSPRVRVLVHLSVISATFALAELLVHWSR